MLSLSLLFNFVFSSFYPYNNFKCGVTVKEKCKSFSGGKNLPNLSEKQSNSSVVIKKSKPITLTTTDEETFHFDSIDCIFCMYCVNKFCTLNLHVECHTKKRYYSKTKQLEFAIKKRVCYSMCSVCAHIHSAGESLLTHIFA